MKDHLVGLLICPACLPVEHPLTATVHETDRGDIESGDLSCRGCGKIYPVTDGIADLDPNTTLSRQRSVNKYETSPVLSSYLWSHYADILHDDQASSAYRIWASLMEPHSGLAIDAGAAVGRHTFEMSRKCDMAVGIDSSRTFTRAARELMKRRAMTLSLKQEGNIWTEVRVELPPEWASDRVEFIVADALAMPFRTASAGSLTSLNLIDKVSRPLRHLEEMNRVTRPADCQFLLSDPFSWSEEAADEAQWLGGKTSGSYAGRGLDNIITLLAGDACRLLPRWDIVSRGEAWWKIRTHANHFEQIRSCYVKAIR